MGTNESKYVQKTVDKPIEETGNIPSTPILTSKVNHDEDENSQMDEWDPRSPSRHIARTPIEILSAAADKLSTLTIETTENDNPIMETPLKRHLILGIDPRSPTVGLPRTPIVISPTPDTAYPSGIKNKNIEKVKKIDLMENSKPSSSASPKLLSSHPITPKIIKNDAYKRKSFVLLETNIDYTETDLDAVMREKHTSALKNEEEPAEDCCANTSSNENEYDTAGEESLTDDQLIDAETEVGISNDVYLPEVAVVQCLLPDHIENNENSDIETEDVVTIIEPLNSETVISAGVPEEEAIAESSIGELEVILEPDMSEKDNTETNAESEEKTVNNSDEDETQFDNMGLVAPLLCTKSAPVSPPNMICVTPKQSKSEPVTPPVVNLTADVRELDKKLTNLIYEDEDPVVCPRAVKPRNQNRTPLGPKNEDCNRRTKLKVSDKPRKSINPCSKIPVFKEKRIKVQCENIPPNVLNAKPQKPHWDSKDDTLVI